MRKSSQQSTHPKIIIPPAHGSTPTPVSVDSEMEVQTDPAVKRRDSSHLTPTKANTLKKIRSCEDDVANATLLQAITSLTARFDSQDEKFEEMANQMRRNSVMIAEISKAVEFNAAEIKECKEKCQETRKSLLNLTTSHKDLENRTSELERYKRRWNLRINGMKERPEEDPRREVIGLIAEIAPHLVQKLEDVVDTVHRIGKKEPGKPRQMIDGRLIADPSYPEKLMDPGISVSSDRLVTSRCVEELRHEIQCHSSGRHLRRLGIPYTKEIYLKYIFMRNETAATPNSDVNEATLSLPISDQFWWISVLLIIIIIMILLLICFILHKNIFR
ncbi:unnamed protein product [Leuciscus chuanchicus]